MLESEPSFEDHHFPSRVVVSQTSLKPRRVLLGAACSSTLVPARNPRGRGYSRIRRGASCLWGQASSSSVPGGGSASPGIWAEFGGIGMMRRDGSGCDMSRPSGFSGGPAVA